MERARIQVAIVTYIPTDRHGDWIQLVSGKPFWPLDPRPGEITIEDIAWSLSMQCRYAGHTTQFYSVAEHSVMVASIVPEQHALWGLLHDAAEAYLVDLPRPVKQLMPTYREAEDRLAGVIAHRFGLSWPMPSEVEEADRAMLGAERLQMMATSELEWPYPGGEADVRLSGWSPAEAHHHFLRRFSRLTGEIP